MNRSLGFKIAAALILGLTALLWIVKAASDLLGGVSGGSFNLILALVLFGLTWLSWKRMLLGGLITAFLGVIIIVSMNLLLPDIYSMAISFFQMFLPMAIAGLLSIEADWYSKKRIR